MYGKLQHHWYVLPILSGVLLALTFHPFNLWPLCFVALVPLYYFVTGFTHRTAVLFWGGWITGAIFSFTLSYFTVLQFHWLNEAYLFATAVKLMVVPITLLSGAMVGLLSVLVYKKLQGDSVLLNMLLGGAVYTATEALLRFVFGGYYLGVLSYAVVDVPALMIFASLGGGLLLSFLVALINGIIVGIVEWPRRAGAFMRAAAGIAVVCVLVGGASALYVSRAPEAVETRRVGVVQGGALAQEFFGKEEAGVFVAPHIEERLVAAAARAPDLLIYPFSPVEGALYSGAAPALNKDVLAAEVAVFGAFAHAHLPASTTLLTWSNYYEDGFFYNQYQLWRQGSVESAYNKRHLFPFMDYTPAWAARLGLYTTPFDVAPAPVSVLPELWGMPLGSLMCSEVHDTGLARGDARMSPLLIAVGSEAMFEGPVASEFSLKAAQLRAAENQVPVVRGNILGPSAIIARDGSLVSRIPAGAEGILYGSVELRPPYPTLYNLFGDASVAGLLCVILGAALWRRNRSR